MKRNGGPEAFRTNCPLSAVMGGGGVFYVDMSHLSDEYLALPLCEVVVLGRGPGDEVAPRQVLGHQH